MKTMKHKEYAASIEYREGDGCLVGNIASIRDIVGSHGETVTELRSAFEEAVDDYLETCAKLGKEPQRSYSGRLMLRIPPAIHAAVATAAETSGKGINQLVSEILDQTVRDH